MKLLAALFFGLSGFLFVLQPALAQEKKDGSLTVSPAYIEVTLTEPDEQQTIPLRFTNNSSVPLTLEMFPLNFNQTDANGTIGFLSQDSGSYSYSLASYLSLSANQLQIDPKQSAVFNVVVRNRPDLTPGGHYGAVIAKVVSGLNDPDGAVVAPSLSSLIFLRKTGGERYNLSLKQTGEEGSFSVTYPSRVQLEFQNEGNVHLVPYGTVEITDMFGRVLKRGVLNTSSFFVMPESKRNIEVQLENSNWSFPLSFNTLTVRGNDSLKKTTFLYRNSSFYLNPWFVVGVLLVASVVIYLKRRRKGEKTKVVQTEMFEADLKPKRKRKSSK